MDYSSDEGSPLFGRWGTLALVLFLVVPYGFHKVAKFEPFPAKSEPYPAIIFPGGANLVTSIEGDRVVFSALSFVGFDAAGNEVEVDATELLNPIPPSYAHALGANMFGQDTTSSLRLTLRGLGVRMPDVPRRVPSEEARAEARRWVADKLETLGLDPTEIRVRYDLYEVDYDTGQVLARETVTEKVVELD